MKWSLVLIPGLTLIGCADPQASQADQETSPTRPGSKAAVAVAPKRVANGPFGLAMGQPISELDVMSTENTDPSQARLLASVPRPMAELDTYAVVAYPETGVCEIRSVSRTFESDAYGNNVKSAMHSLSDALDSKYGKHRKTDACSDYNCEFFQQNLNSGSQVYSYEWSSATGAKLPPDIEEVSLVALPGEFNGTYFRLDYQSASGEACRAAERKSKAAAL